MSVPVAVQTRTGLQVHATTNRVSTLCGWSAYGGVYTNGALVVTCYWCRRQLKQIRLRATTERYRIDALMGGDDT